MQEKDFDYIYANKVYIIKDFELITATHTPSDWIITKEATCTEAGSRHKVCTVCGEELKLEVILTTGHAYGEWAAVTEATCMVKGSEERVCENDETHKETRDTNALNHDLENNGAKAPTCTEVGWKAYDTCKRCDYRTCEEIPAMGHTSNNLIVDREASVGVTGHMHKECMVCGETLEEEDIPALLAKSTGCGSITFDGGGMYAFIGLLIAIPIIVFFSLRRRNKQ